MFVLSTGDGVNGFTLDPIIGEFFLSHPDLKLEPRGKTFSLNEAYQADWPDGLAEYVASLKAPGAGWSARYIGSLVADFHRNLIKGGIFLYPGTRSKPEGKLRLLYEGFPLAILEAMAAGLPVVTTRVAGNPEAVDDRVHGRLVEAEDEAGLAEALLDLIRDEEGRRRMGRQARQRVVEEFSIERIGAAYFELWTELAGPPAGSTSISDSQVDAPRSENQPTNS